MGFARRVEEREEGQVGGRGCGGGAGDEVLLGRDEAADARAFAETAVFAAGARDDVVRREHDVQVAVVAVASPALDDRGALAVRRATRAPERRRSARGPVPADRGDLRFYCRLGTTVRFK